MNHKLPTLPLNLELESKTVLKKLVDAHKALAELKGVAKTIPNDSILITTLSLQEAKDSSAIENVITTHDELFQNNSEDDFTSVAAKEVHSYANALRYAVGLVKENGLLTINHILEVQQQIEENNAGFRPIVVGEPRNAEVRNFQYVLAQAVKNICWLDVTMNYTLIVRVVERLGRACT